MNRVLHLQTIPELNKLFSLEGRIHHPLICVVDFSGLTDHINDVIAVTADFYCMLFKNYNKNYIKYGRKVVDFQDGSLICVAPNQLIEMDYDIDISGNMMGWGVFFHPDLIRSTSLNDKMKNYTFFSYEVSEALHLSEKEKQILTDCVFKLQAELTENIDVYSQAIIVSTLEMLLSYCDRFYGRQFITRKSSNNTVVGQIEKALSAYFKEGGVTGKGLPTVKYLAELVSLSPGYLSDLLKKETGKNTQDLIHFYLIEEAKSILLSTDKSVGEIAYALGFEYPQYFNKLFKKKTGKTPVEFRSMN